MPGLTMTALPAEIVKGLAHVEPLPITAQRLIDIREAARVDPRSRALRLRPRDLLV